MTKKRVNIHFQNRRFKESHLTFKDILTKWFATARLNVKPATAFRYEYLMERHILPTLGELPITQITAGRVNEFMEEKMKTGKLNGTGGLSAAYVKAMSNIIKMVVDYGVTQELCLPLKTKIKRPSNPKKEITVLSREEQSRLKGYMDQNMDTTCLGILLSLYAGLRIGEVCALSWEEVDLCLGVIHVRHTVARVKSTDGLTPKGSQLILDNPKTPCSRRDIPISSILMPYLYKAREAAVSPFVVSDREFFLSPRTFSYRYHQIIQKSGSPPIHYHALRHTFATRCVEAEVDIKSLSEMLGHSSVVITLNTYVHSSMEQKRKQLEKLTA